MIDRKALEIRHRKGLRQCKERWQYEDKWLTPRAIGKAGVTPVPCSCPMCGNPRRNYRGKHALTIQELKARQASE
jgi:hypothetical protein